MAKLKYYNNHIFLILKACRIAKVFSIIFGVFTISIYALGSINYLVDRTIFINVLLGLGSLFFLICAGYLMNDYCDIKYDKINRKDELIISKLVDKDTAMRFCIAFFVIGMILAVMVNVWFLLMVILDVIFLTFYNLFSKRLSYFKSFVISLLVVSIYPLSIALVLGGFPSLRRTSLFIFPVWLFFTVLAYEMMHDIFDIKGDSLYKAATLPVKIGRSKTRYIATTSVLFAMPFAFLPFYYEMCGMIYLLGLFLAICILLWTMFCNDMVFSKGILFYIRAVTVASLIDIIWYQ